VSRGGCEADSPICRTSRRKQPHAEAAKDAKLKEPLRTGKDAGTQGARSSVGHPRPTEYFPGPDAAADPAQGLSLLVVPWNYAPPTTYALEGSRSFQRPFKTRNLSVAPNPGQGHTGCQVISWPSQGNRILPWPRRSRRSSPRLEPSGGALGLRPPTACALEGSRSLQRPFRTRNLSMAPSPSGQLEQAKTECQVICFAHRVPGHLFRSVSPYSAPLAPLA